MHIHTTRNQSWLILAVLLSGLAAVMGGFWWLCTCDNGIAFLSKKPGAEWIQYPKPPETLAQHAVPISALFRYKFALNRQPTNATLFVRAFKSATITVNGQKPIRLDLSGQNWKSTSMTEVTSLLQPGPNEIIARVTNSLGPPALWLRLQSDQLKTGTGGRWEVSLDGLSWREAHRASQPPQIPDWSGLSGGERISDSIRRVWPWLVAFSGAAMVILGAYRYLQRRRQPAATPSANLSAQWIYVLLTVVLIARGGLFINNALQLPRLMGFDADAHEQYIQYIQENHRLPAPQNGWEMHQPPLYYALSALVLDTCGLSVSNDNAVLAMRAVNGMVGLVHCWLALLCLQLLFPKNLSAQAVGLLAISFVPSHLYLSQYVTNEPLAGLLVTLALYFLLRVLQSEGECPFLHLGIGMALGAAMLTKFSVLLAVPVFLAVLGLRLLALNKSKPRQWLGSVGVVLLVLLVVCGWDYVRLWIQIGNVPLPNWETDPAHAWREDPGFRTSSYYFSFGRALVSPLFSAIYSFADGIYSTLWGDGLASGTALMTYRPPWNYDLMNAGYLLGTAMSILMLVGLAVSLVNFIRRPRPEWLVILGLVGVFALGIIYLTLRGPWLAHVKAFYAFPALVPFGALVATGWLWLGQKHRVISSVSSLLLLVWTMTVYGAFWIRKSNPETYQARGIYLASQHRYTDAMENFARALKLAPDNAAIHVHMADILSQQNRPVDAAHEYREALQIKSNFPEALNHFAWFLATSKEPGTRDSGQAVQLAERACELTQYQKPTYIATLVAAYTEDGQLDAALAAEQKLHTLTPASDEILGLETRITLATKLNNTAWVLATGRDVGMRDGTLAIRYAEQACALTDFKQGIFVGTLAAAYAAAGRFGEAITTAEKACALAAKSGQTELLRKNQELLNLYQNHQTYREPSNPPGNPDR